MSSYKFLLQKLAVGGRGTFEMNRLLAKNYCQQVVRNNQGVLVSLGDVVIPHQFPRGSNPVVKFWQATLPVSLKNKSIQDKDAHVEAVNDYVNSLVKEDCMLVWVIGTHLKEGNPKKLSELVERIKSENTVLSNEEGAKVNPGHIGAIAQGNVVASHFKRRVSTAEEAIKKQSYILARECQLTTIYFAQIDLNQRPHLLDRMKEEYNKNHGYDLGSREGKLNCATYMQRVFGLNLGTISPMITFHAILEHLIESSNVSLQHKNEALELLVEMGMARDFKQVHDDEYKYKEGIEKIDENELPDYIHALTIKNIAHSNEEIDEINSMGSVIENSTKFSPDEGEFDIELGKKIDYEKKDINLDEDPDEGLDEIGFYPNYK